VEKDDALYNAETRSLLQAVVVVVVVFVAIG
jgi:hypothetical protein